ncbi:MAG: hypothetical protein PVG86_03755 [Desulfobacterales bacterium]|jgi:hypothetical protein
MKENNLFNVFLNLFSETDAFLLAKLLKDNLYKETIRYPEIDIAESQKKDLILLAFEERILIPVTSRTGPAWEDKVLDFRKDGQYLMPPCVKAMMNTICETGKPSCDTAVRKTLTHVIQEDLDGYIKLLQTLMKHVYNYIFETGLLKLFFKEAAMDGDFHDIIDIFVICGMISPCPRKSLMTGLSWYEINPTLYWDKTFLL